MKHQPVLKKKKRGRKKKTQNEDHQDLDEEKPKKRRGRPKGSGGLGLGETTLQKDENGEAIQEDLFNFPQDESLRDPSMRHQCDRCVRGFMLKPEFHQVRSKKSNELGIQ